MKLSNFDFRIWDNNKKKYMLLCDAYDMGICFRFGKGVIPGFLLARILIGRIIATLNYIVALRIRMAQRFTRATLLEIISAQHTQ